MTFSCDLKFFFLNFYIYEQYEQDRNNIGYHPKHFSIMSFLYSRGEYALQEYTEVKAVTIKISQKNS